MELTRTMLLLILPILAIQLGLMIYALVKVIKSKTTKYMSQAIWILIIILLNIIGPILYLVLEGGQDDRD
jgi:uncharacterized membrane protein YczE